MITWVAGCLGATAVGGAAYAAFNRRYAQRSRHYRELADRRSTFIRGHDPVLAVADPSPEIAADFAREPVVRIGDFLTLTSLEILRQEALAAAPTRKRSYVPTHKKGGAVSYETLHRSCPSCLAFYHGAPVRDWVSKLVGLPVGPAGDHDQSANSLLIYDEPGDHIHWHFDHNFYKGRQFTALISLVNRGPGNGERSASNYVYRSPVTGQDVTVDSSENTFIVFEGAHIRHKATPSAAGDLRIVLSMTFNTDPRISVVGETLRRVKDTAFFGLRVLWA